MVFSSPPKLPAHNRAEGTVLFEFAIIVPLLLLLVAFLFLLGRLIWQYQLLCDAARYGARTAALESERDTTLSCTQLEEKAVTAAAAYRYNNRLKWSLESVWGDPVAWESPSIQYKFESSPFPHGMRIRMMNVKFSAGVSNNCLFCFSDWKKMSLDAVASMDLHYGSSCQ